MFGVSVLFSALEKVYENEDNDKFCCISVLYFKSGLLADNSRLIDILN